MKTPRTALPFPYSCQGCVSWDRHAETTILSPPSMGSNTLQRRDHSLDVKAELERRAAAERKARRKTYGIESEEYVDVEEEREQIKVGTASSDGLPPTDRSEGVDMGFRNTGGSPDVTDPIIDGSTRADENSNTDHDPVLSASSGGNAVGEADDSPGVCDPVTDKAPSRGMKPEGKQKTAWCVLKGRIKKLFRSCLQHL
ncbi:hypothetical protein FALCPG4_003804 [Fusarium falciforme]